MRALMWAVIIGVVVGVMYVEARYNQICRATNNQSWICHTN